jgi:hypothetical protein
MTNFVLTDMATSDENISISAFQSAGLVAYTRTLAEIAKIQTTEKETVALATATLLMAAAALEALVTEAAYEHKKELYELQDFRDAGAPSKFERLKKYSSPEAIELWKLRKAVAHAEPDNKRTRFVGEKLNVEGAEWAAATIEKISREVWEVYPISL